MMFSVNEILDIAMRLEKNGETFYRRAMGKISEPSLVSALENLADEEVKHHEWFSDKKASLHTNPDSQPELEEMASVILQEIFGDQSFSLEEADFSKIDSLKKLLSLAIEFEEDSVLFYEMIKSLADNLDTSGGIHEIIEEEKRHIGRLKFFLDGGTELDLLFL